jgi:hypothetical protein
MIGSWFAQGATWAWEVTAADSTVIASGVAADEATARWECRMAIFVAGTAAGPTDTAPAVAPPRASFGGRLCGRPSAAA